MDDKIGLLVKQYAEKVILLRRHFHKYPEVSGKEFNTQKKIMEELTAIGLQPRKAAGTGVVVEIEGTRPGKTVAVRADMDALKIQDEGTTEYHSVHDGVCHACGHDGHTAMLLGVAQILSEYKEFSGTVRLLFQPTEEEPPSGAMSLIKEGALDGVASIIGVHLWQALAVGTIGSTYGPMMASPDEFIITVQGRGGHGSMPHQTVDALLAGTQIVLALNTVISRNVDPMDSAVLSVCSFQSGNVYNVIPDTATIRGTIRTFKPELRQAILSRIEQIVQGIGAATGTTCVFKKGIGCPPVINAPEIVKEGMLVGAEIVGADKVLEISPVMSGEDFSCYQEKIPGGFFFIGSGNPAKGIVYPQHHPKFDIDEVALSYGTEFLVRTVLKLL